MNFEDAVAQVKAEDAARHAKWLAEAKAKPESERTFLDEMIVRDYVYPWYQTAYYRTRYAIKSFFKGYWIGTIKEKYRRAKRGYSNVDRWNLPYYLAGWLPKALRELSADAAGCPGIVYDFDGTVLYEHTEGNFDKNYAVWQQTLIRMAQGFEAINVLESYGWGSVRNGMSEAEAELHRYRDEGLALFMNNFEALWD